ncbi:MAG: hypothetical protein E7620_01830 [Ruminococcaceae bacterium]|nr:hypothetical protein [Oscillospiraceae bacterium]
MGIFFDTINGKQTNRAPVMTKIWLDLAAKLTGKAPLPLFSDSAAAAETVVEAAIRTENDCSRLFLFAPRQIEVTEQGAFHVRNGRVIGKVDARGGCATLLSDPADLDLSDPATAIHYNIYKCREPLMPTVADVQRLRIPTPAEYEAVFGKTVEACQQRAAGRLDLAGDCNSGTLAFCVAMNGMSKALMDIYDEPELLHAMMERGIDLSIQTAKFLISKGIRILRYNDSAANMNVISPDCWREFIKPHITRFCKEVHAFCPEARIYCHICGGVMPILRDLVETGLDCIAPLDPLGGNSIEEIRRVTEDSVMLMGGMNTLSFLNRTPEQVEEEARACILAGRKNNGRFAVGSGCAMPPNATAESILALARASRALADG